VTTLLDVAGRAGVSKSTVSNVIRGTAFVSEATRERVERVIAETGYHPNAIARSLKARASTAIGFVVPDLTNPFYAQLAVGVERGGEGQANEPENQQDPEEDPRGAGAGKRVRAHAEKTRLPPKGHAHSSSLDSAWAACTRT